MKIETISFFRTHILMNGKRELFPVVNLVLDQSYPEISQIEGLQVNVSTERSDYENAPLVLLHVTLQIPDQFTIRKTKSIDYMDRSTVEFFEDIFSEDPFLIGFSTREFLESRTKEFQYIPAYLTKEDAMKGKWDIELAYTDAGSRDIDAAKLDTLLKQWWEKEGKILNEAQDGISIKN